MGDGAGLFGEVEMNGGWFYPCRNEMGAFALTLGGAHLFIEDNDGHKETVRALGQHVELAIAHSSSGHNGCVFLHGD